MASITIRNLAPEIKAQLRVRAAQHGRSMEAEAREILTSGLGQPAGRLHMVDRIRQIVEPLGGIELEIPPRRSATLPDFSGPEFDR